MPVFLLRRQRSRDHGFEASLGKQLERPYLKKYLTQKRAGGVVQVVEHLPSKHEAQFKPQFQKKMPLYL
jgi:hypothetical protein